MVFPKFDYADAGPTGTSTSTSKDKVASLATKYIVLLIDRPLMTSSDALPIDFVKIAAVIASEIEPTRM